MIYKKYHFRKLRFKMLVIDIVLSVAKETFIHK